MANNPDIDAALRRELSGDAIRPLGIHLERQKSLTVNWADGRQSVFPLTFLRQHCPCASCRSTPPAPAATGRSLTILPADFDKRAIAQTASLVGNYAIQITWADGHSTGIYDFSYLRALDKS